MMRNMIKSKSMIDNEPVLLTLMEMLANPDVRAGRLSYRIVKVVESEDEFMLIRGVMGGEPYHLFIQTFSEAVDALERDSVYNSIWYGEPKWIRKPDFKNGAMVDIMPSNSSEEMTL